MGSLARKVAAVAATCENGAYRHNDYVLRTVFQPIYGVADCAVVGFEGLVRALGPQGPIAADRLFTGEEAAVVDMDRACRALHLRSFAAVDRGIGRLFLNVHPLAAIADRAALREFSAAIGYYGLAPGRIAIEILESGRGDEGELAEAVAAYRELGFLIAMDDFGVERSNFDRVMTLRPDLVKVDRSILADALGDAKARRMLPHVIDIVHEAGARVVIEGVEGAGEALLAIEAGGDFLQGRYFSHPRPDLHDDVLTDRILHELVRMRSPVIAPAPVMNPVVAASRPSAGAVARLLGSARDRTLDVAEHKLA